MYLDKQLEFSLEQAITVTAASTNVIDLGADAGAGEVIRLLAQVDEAFTAAGAATLVVAVQSATDAAFSSPITHFQTDAIGKASLIVGYEINLPPLPPDHERYVRLYFTVGTGPMTAGKITAYLVKDLQTNKTSG